MIPLGQYLNWQNDSKSLMTIKHMRHCYFDAIPSKLQQLALGRISAKTNAATQQCATACCYDSPATWGQKKMGNEFK